MIYLIGFLTVLILALALVVLNKVPNVLGKKSESEDSDIAAPNNNANAWMSLIFLVLLLGGTAWSYIEYKQYFLPEAASEHGRETDSQFWFDMGLLTIAFVIVNFLLFYFSWKYKYKKGYKATFLPENHTLELVWTAIPAVIMAVLVILGYRSWSNIMSDPPKKGLQTIEIMGRQFNWHVRYGGVEDNKLGKYNFKLINANNEMGVDFYDEKSFDDFQPQEMHVVVGRPVLLQIRARDVLHSVYIPHMRVKMDAVPGMPTRFWFMPEKTTDDMRGITGNGNFDYEIACTEVCGTGHFSMRFKLVVESQASYDKWLATQKPLLSQILEADPKFIDKIPANLKAKALKYAPAPAEPVEAPADSTVVE